MGKVEQDKKPDLLSALCDLIWWDPVLRQHVASNPVTSEEVFGETYSHCSRALADSMRVAGKHARCSPVHLDDDSTTFGNESQ